MTAPDLIGLVRRDADGRTVTAAVSRRAAALRMLRSDGVDLVEPTTATTQPPGMAGALLAPWPNRVQDAVWQLDGVDQYLDVTEPDAGNAIHGLLGTTDFEVRELREDAVTLGAAILQRPGYPFALDVSTRYRLLEDGIAAEVTVVNLGRGRAPVALGAHPYLRIGDAPTDSLKLTLQADHRWPLDARHLPAGGRRPLEHPLVDVPLSDAPRHATFETGAPGTGIAHTLTAPDGRRVVLNASPEYCFTQLWIPDALDTDEGLRRAVAVEPMTAPPNALRSGVGLHLLDEGERWTTGWSIRLSAG